MQPETLDEKWFGATSQTWRKSPRRFFFCWAWFATTPLLWLVTDHGEDPAFREGLAYLAMWGWPAIQFAILAFWLPNAISGRWVATYAGVVLLGVAWIILTPMVLIFGLLSVGAIMLVAMPAIWLAGAFLARQILVWSQASNTSTVPYRHLGKLALWFALTGVMPLFGFVIDPEIFGAWP